MDISLSGAFLRCDIELKVGSQYHLKASSPSAAELPFRVAREIPRAQVAKKEARHYGLTFLPSPGDEQRLRLLLDKLPRGDSLEQDKRARSVRGYWS
ncbi:MAG: hypothetical protein A2506_04745 [Elusimicrobia bacterium RIFOXYD12_FULL_66_9]|nr:MAG: hypothetical protein A2506_04745 [Elusimicrobia bacterium RIFOXYD12_FULL_66_9]